MKRIALLLTLFSLAACSDEKPFMQYMPHMGNTWILKSQRGYDGNGNGASVMMPPAGTLPRGYKPYRIGSAEEAAVKLTNPLPRNAQTLARGQQMFNNYCVACHGDRGHGDGPVVPPFPIPKSLQSDAMMKWRDGHIFHVITKGQGAMPAYAQQIQPKDRWAIIHYVRALQRADHPTEEDIRVYQKRVAK